MSKIGKSILIIIPGRAEIPSVRLRILQFCPNWVTDGFSLDVIVWNTGMANIARNFARLMIACLKADIVLIHRVVFGRYQAELIVYFLSLLNVPYIFDFDDALYAVPVAPQHRSLYEKDTTIYSGRKRNLDILLKNADAVTVGNGHLATYVVQTTSAPVTVIPTVLDVANLPIKVHKVQTPVVVGWVGTNDNLRYLEQIRAVLQHVSNTYQERVLFRIVSGLDFPALEGRIENVRWSLEQELDQVLSFDIGLMPLAEDEWSQGKSGFKAVFYQSLGIPVVATPTEVVVHGETGFCALTDEEWNHYIGVLVDSPSLRAQMGHLARAHSENSLSLRVALAKWRQVFSQAIHDSAEKGRRSGQT